MRLFLAKPWGISQRIPVVHSPDDITPREVKKPSSVEVNATTGNRNKNFESEFCMAVSLSSSSPLTLSRTCLLNLLASLASIYF